MSSTTFSAIHLDAPAMPLGSRIAAAAFMSVERFVTQLLTPRVKSRGEEAAEVRHLADELRAIDPGFAADLYAAAARHEGLDG